MSADEKPVRLYMRSTVPCPACGGPLELTLEVGLIEALERQGIAEAESVREGCPGVPVAPDRLPGVPGGAAELMATPGLSRGKGPTENPRVYAGCLPCHQGRWVADLEREHLDREPLEALQAHCFRSGL